MVLCPTRGIPGMAHSSAARAGMQALTQVLSVEWGKYDIGVVCVAPGWIDTEGMRQYGDDLEELAKLVPMRRLGTAEEVADTIAFLVRRRRAYITGQTIVIDGGIENTVARRSRPSPARDRLPVARIRWYRGAVPPSRR